MEAPNAKSHLFSSGALSHKATASPVLSLCLVTDLIWSCACNSAHSSKTKQKNPHEVYVNVFCRIHHVNSHVTCACCEQNPINLANVVKKTRSDSIEVLCILASAFNPWPWCVGSRFLYFLCGISTPLRPSLHPINKWLSLCSVIMNPSVWKVTSAVDPRTVTMATMNERVGLSNVKGFEMSWWLWLLRHGQRCPALSWRTRMCPMSSKRCSSPQNGAFGKWCFDRFDVCLHSGTNADSCVRLVNSTALMSTKRTQRSVLQSHLCCIGAVSWQK